MARIDPRAAAAAAPAPDQPGEERHQLERPERRRAGVAGRAPADDAAPRRPADQDGGEEAAGDEPEHAAERGGERKRRLQEKPLGHGSALRTSPARVQSAQAMTVSAAPRPPSPAARHGRRAPRGRARAVETVRPPIVSTSNGPVRGQRPPPGGERLALAGRSPNRPAEVDQAGGIVGVAAAARR